MTNEELKILLNAESDRVERKRQLKNAKESVEQTICAFANDFARHSEPGFVVIGVEDNGQCVGLNISDELLREIADIRSSGNILPFPMLTVAKAEIDGCAVVLITVQPSSDTPVRYRGVIWIRVGPTTRVASPEEELRLIEKRRSGNQPFDLSPVANSSIEDLDMSLFERTYLPASVAREILEQNQRTAEQKLRSLRLLDHKSSRATVTGILAVGNAPDEFIPGSYIQFLKLDGISLSDPIVDEKRISGPLPELLRQLDELLQINITTRVSITGSVETRRPDYPIDALRQMARNAVMHRSYEGTNAPVRIYWFSDRVEIHSPGGPYGQVTVGNFGMPGVTDYRNPHIAEVMKNLGFVQKFGAGFQIASSQLAENGNPPLEKDVQTSNVLILLRRAA